MYRCSSSRLGSGRVESRSSSTTFDVTGGPIAKERIMSFVSRGFRGRRRDEEVDPTRLPPGQYVTDDFPVLSAGPTPHTPLDRWTFTVAGNGEQKVWSWDEFRALPSETVTVDIHCV